MTVKEAAEFLGLTTRHIMRLLYSGKLKAAKIRVVKPVAVKIWDISEDSVYDLKAKRESV